MEKFNTPVEIEIDYDSMKPQGFSYESRTSKANIEYHFILELRSWGIKSMIFLLPAQEINFDVELLKDNEEDSDNYSFKLKISGDTEMPENFSSGDISPNNLSLEITDLHQTGPNSFEGSAKAVLSFEST